MDSSFFKTLRIAPTTQQGGTQTIQQSIYLTHNNPCGANLLIFKKMGLTQIRYIDLKNYVDEILKSEQMTELFQVIRESATVYIYDPKDEQRFNEYIYNTVEWASNAMANLPVKENHYPGYLFRVNVYDGSGTMLFDSYYPNLRPMKKVGPLYVQQRVKVLPSNPYYWIENTGLFKYGSAYQVPFVNHLTQVGFESILSNFPQNQSGMQETVMAVASLLVDSANTRSFGVPKYGFSARQSLSPFAGITYNCSHIIDIYTVPTEDEPSSTLVESIFFRLSLEEDTWPAWAHDIVELSNDQLAFVQNTSPDVSDEADPDADPYDNLKLLYRFEKYKEYMRSK